MKRLMQLLLVELIVVAGLAIALAALLLTAPGSETESYVFSAREVTDITSVQVENENGTVSVTTQDGGYLIDGVPSELVDTDAFIEFLTACSQVATQQRAAGGGADAEQYGLSEPQAQMTASYSDGETLTLKGAQVVVTGGYGIHLEGDLHIALAEGSENTINSTHSDSIHVSGSLTISGPGALTATVTEGTYQAGAQYAGIYGHRVTIKSGTVTVTMNIPFALLYIFLGGSFLYSAYSIWKKNKENRG